MRHRQHVEQLAQDRQGQGRGKRLTLRVITLDEDWQRRTRGPSQDQIPIEALRPLRIGGFEQRADNRVGRAGW